MVTMYSPESAKVEKMSKSKGNVVPLDHAVANYGADATRMATLYLGPSEQDAEWASGQDEDGKDKSDKVFAGPYRFLERVWRLVQARPFNKDWRESLNYSALSGADMKLARKTHQTILKVQSDIENFSLNTAIAALMEHVNTLQEWVNASKDGGDDAVYSEAVESLLLCLAPFAPHLADEMLESIGYASTSYEMAWPQGNAEVAREDEIEIPVQVNGKLRARLQVAADIEEEALRSLALNSAEVQSHLEGKEPKRVIVVPKRLVNIVI
jgi:leucyl-tRNA synthetase